MGGGEGRGGEGRGGRVCAMDGKLQSICKQFVTAKHDIIVQRHTHSILHIITCTGTYMYMYMYMYMYVQQ